MTANGSTGSGLAEEARAALATIMEQEGLSAKEVERRTGVDNTTVGRILRGDNVPSLAMFDRIITGLGYDVSLRIE